MDHVGILFISQNDVEPLIQHSSLRCPSCLDATSNLLRHEPIHMDIESTHEGSLKDQALMLDIHLFAFHLLGNID